MKIGKCGFCSDGEEHIAYIHIHTISRLLKKLSVRLEIKYLFDVVNHRCTS